MSAWTNQLSFTILKIVNLLVETLAESTANAADAGSKEKEDNGGEDEPDPDVWSALSVNCQRSEELLGHAGLLVAVGDVLHALVVRHTLASPELLHIPLQFFLSLVEGLVDVIISISGFTTC